MVNAGARPALQDAAIRHMWKWLCSLSDRRAAPRPAERCSDEATDMPVSAQASTNPWPMVLLSLAGGALFAVTIGLWFYFGTAVFFEMVRNGLAACF